MTNTSIAHNINNIEFMRQTPDKHFSIAIVDPPYGINAPNMQMGTNPNRKEEGQYPGTSVAVKLKKGRLNQGAGKLKNRNLNTMNCEWDNEKPPQEYWDHLFRISKNQIIWGGNYFTDHLPQSRCWVVWNKNQPWDNFSQAELAWTSFDKPMKVFTFSNRGGENSEQKIHPTQKPIQLYDYLIKQFCTKDDHIFDSHLGSGSSRIAAFKAEINFTATEIDTFFFSQQETRFSKFKNVYRKQYQLIL